MAKNQVLSFNGVLLILFVFSCSKTTKNNDDQNKFIHDTAIQKVVFLKKESNNSTNLKINIINTVPLETSDDFLISSNLKVQEVNNQFFVLDQKFDALKVFDERGRFVMDIGGLGGGPGEFQEINDFNIDYENEQLLLYSLEDMKLYFYELNGEFIKTVALDFYADRFRILNNDKLCFYINYNPSTESDLYNMLITDYEGNITKRLMPYSDQVNMSISFSGMMYSNGEEIFHNHALSDSLFIFNHQYQVKEVIHFDFNGNDWEYGFDFNKIYQLEMDKLAHLSTSMFANDSIIFTSFLYKRKFRNLVINRGTYDAFSSINSPDSFFLNLISVPHYEASNGNLISSISYSSFSTKRETDQEGWLSFKKKNPAISEEFERLFNEEPNPVLVEYAIEFK